VNFSQQYFNNSLVSHYTGGVAQWLERQSMTGKFSLQLTGDLNGVNRSLPVSQHGQLSHSSSWVDKWAVSWTQEFAMRICVLAPPEKCLRVKADMVLFAGNNAWSISQRVRGVHEDALYKSTLPLLLPYASELAVLLEYSSWWEWHLLPSSSHSRPFKPILSLPWQ